MSWRIVQTLLLAILGVCALAPPTFATEVVEIWTRVGPSPSEAEHLFASFHEANPDIRVEVTPKSVDEVLVASAAGIAPDIFTVDGIAVQSWAASGLLANLDNIIDRTNTSIEDFWPPVLSEILYEGSVYAIPHHTTSHILFYNRDHFESYGIGGPPTYWDELVEIGKRFTVDENGDGAADRFGLDITLGAGEFGIYILTAYIWQNNGRIANDDGTEVLLDKPEAMGAFEFLASLTQEHGIVPLPGQRNGNFESGFFSMAHLGSWLFRPFDQVEGLNWVAAPTPYPRTGERVSGLGGWHWAMSNAGSHRPAVQKVMEYLTTPELVLGMSELYGMPVLRSVAAENDRLTSYPWIVAIEQLMYARARPSHLHNYNVISEVLSSAFLDVMERGMPVRGTVENAADRIRLALQEADEGSPLNFR